MMIPLLERVASSNFLFSIAVIVELVSIHLMYQFVEQIKDLGRGPPPDMRFGYTQDELYAWYEGIGEEGRKLYLSMVRFDLFPYMATYAVLLGAITLNLARQAQMPDKIALIFPIAMWFDFMETVIPGYGANLYPKRLPEFVVLVAIGGNQLKWLSFGVGMAILTALFLYTSVRPSVAIKDKATKVE